jgi:hypothetical protein
LNRKSRGALRQPAIDVSANDGIHVADTTSPNFVNDDVTPAAYAQQTDEAVVKEILQSMVSQTN